MLFILVICLLSYFKIVYNENSYESLFGVKTTEYDNSMYCVQERSPEHYSVTNRPYVVRAKLLNETTSTEDPRLVLEILIHNFMFGSRLKLFVRNSKFVEKDPLIFPSGDIWRYDMYGNETGVHLPMREFFVSGHCQLKIKDDYLQTAVNAFAIISMGTVADILRLPAQYVLASTRSISMMKLCHEKFAAFWTVVKGDIKTIDISHEVLEKFRPLFKYVNAREIARLNLKNDKILTYIGTHPDLDRHQVGVIAKRYIQLNPSWAKPKYLNMMNNLLCGVPMVHMKNISEAYFLQLSQQVFYHIRACEPLQRRFYLKIMTKTQTLGKPYSWSARDITRLGLLLAEVSGPELSTIKPAAMAAISSQVMLQMSAENLNYITEVQQRYLDQQSLNILKKKIKNYKDKAKKSSAADFIYTYKSYLICSIITMHLKDLIAPRNIFI